MSGDFTKRAVCACGETFDAWRGNLFFVAEECCPSCGADKWTFRIEIGSWIDGRWFPRGKEPATLIAPAESWQIVEGEPEDNRTWVAILFVVCLFGAGVALGWALRGAA
jgi:hypothetical protein